MEHEGVSDRGAIMPHAATHFLQYCYNVPDGKIRDHARRVRIAEGGRGRIVSLQRKPLKLATRAICDFLSSAAAEQHAYFLRAPDGRISLELEGLDPAGLVRTAVTAYVEHAGNGKARAAPAKPKRATPRRKPKG